MNRDYAQNILKNIDIVKGIAEGKTIQWKREGWSKWYDFHRGDTIPLNGSANTPWEYRVKPEPRVDYAVLRADEAGEDEHVVSGYFTNVRALLSYAAKFPVTHVVKVMVADGVPSSEIIPFEVFKEANTIAG